MNNVIWVSCVFSYNSQIHLNEILSSHSSGLTLIEKLQLASLYLVAFISCVVGEMLSNYP